ncbi:MAG: UvrD-helicase domain-containing protein [Atopobiaceae bacterium]|jgi:ATP-dependent exoDNAse (exonuclease V) beta subunit|uniref:DNA 3'-5' helicase n=1 Tax=Muricaecibacterium torontonense TaxID=3032871 RepID=A0A4S2F2L7_9ACTN|nr:UvrD-helicase domain-containing protein [Muricaecibacterium torontonense]MCI8675575.1 UvrD-helicase domain-containing protein [Atopobiaceae bacterium]TGY62622.1 hypothetical protein E5334_04225 [Muricaecibacterium torontonense]
MPTLDNAQQSIVDTLDRGLFVEAGAGSGKTFTLVQRLVHALTPDPETGRAYLDDLDQVLIITFTNKAASEIRERVREEFVSRGMHQAAFEVDRAWISTIHGMCERILRESALEAGIDPSFEVVQGHEQSYLLSRAASDVASVTRSDPEFAELYRLYGSAMNAASEEGVAEESKSGSNNTPSALEMALAIAELAASSPEGFSGIRFPGEAPSLRYLVTQCSLALQDLLAVWRPNKGTAGYKKMPLVTQLAEELALLADMPEVKKEGLIDFSERFLEADLKAGSFSKDAKALFYTFRGQLGDALMQVAYEPLRQQENNLLKLAQLIGGRYNHLKVERGVVDNNDLLSLTLRALESNPVIAKRYANRFRLVMVDESQDTDPQQLKIVRLLAGGDDHICYVGDGQQSIYGFRGADVEEYRRVRDRSLDRLVRMNHNYRSHDDILRFVKHSLGDSGILEGFMDLEAFDERKDGYPPAEEPRVVIEHTANYGAKKSLAIKSVADQIANRFQILHKQGVSVGSMALLLRGLNNVDIYIKSLREHGLEALVTAGSSFARSLEVHVIQALLWTLANPRDSYRGTLPLLQSPMFDLSDEDLLFLSKGGRAKGFADALLTPAPDIERVLGRTPSPRLMNAIAVLQKARETMASKPVSQTVRDVCEQSGWLARLGHEGPQGLARQANLLECVRCIDEIIDKRGLGYSRAPKVFSDWLSVAKKGPSTLSTENADAVQIMTIHASKGLEFPVVAIAEAFDDSSGDKRKRLLACSSQGIHSLALSYDPKTLSKLTGLDEGIISKAKSWAEDDLAKVGYEKDQIKTGLDWRLSLEEIKEDRDRQEAARLLYVALTRAREALVIGINTDIHKCGISPKLTAYYLSSLVGEVPKELGVTRFDYGGQEEGVIETVVIEKKDAEDEPEIEEVPAAQRFAMYEAPKLATPLRRWKSSDDIHSYTSDRHQAETLEALAAEDDVQNMQESYTPWAPPQSTGEDPLRFGDAFHELARIAANLRAKPSRQRILAVAKSRELNEQATDRLSLALDNWLASPLCKEAFGYPIVQGEAPFFSAEGNEEYLDSSEGKAGYLTGSIDLLCTDGSRDALVVDYKTGERTLSEHEARELHEMQARYYAHVLMKQGFERVEAAFVLVENVDSEGPLTVRFTFKGEPPKLGAITEPVKETSK